MNRTAAALWLAGAAVACGGAPPVYQSPSAAYVFTIPDSWNGHYTTRIVGSNEGPGPYIEAVDFAYPPEDTTIRPQILLRLVVYRSSVWESLLAEGGPPPGEEVGRIPGDRGGETRVIVAALPQSNPFRPGSPDAGVFDRMAPSLEGVKRAVVVATPAASATSAPIDIAVHPLAIRGRDSVMQAQAESCLTGMIRALGVEDIAATLVPPAAPRGDLQSATVARFSIEGELEKVGDDYRMELRLMDAASGEELRSYFYSGKDPAGIGRTCPSAAPRIAQAIRETAPRP